MLPWHTRRLRIGQLGAALALAAGAVEKIALDVKLMAQTEVGELSESSAGGRGGSSTLPHKRNPVGAALAIACAHGVRGAASVLIAAQAQEHERAAAPGRPRWDALSRALALTGGAAAALAEALDGLEVHPDRMRANLDLTGGLVMTEAVAMRLDRPDAKAVVGEVAAQRASDSGQPLRESPERRGRLAVARRDRRGARPGGVPGLGRGVRGPRAGGAREEGRWRMSSTSAG